MESTSGFWQFVGGIGLFLFAMHQLETALRAFTGGALRGFLRHHTRTGLQSVGVGATATALLQSSSLVGLFVLAFVSASLMSLENALGVIFGANLGTTITGYIVTLLGFKLDLGGIALPMIGVGSLILVGTRGKLAEYGRLFAALGFLLAGLALMKDSVSGLTATYDVSRLAGLSGWQFLLFGIVAAAVVQSSSAVMMLTLTALHANVLELRDAAAVAIGADLGTTSTIIIGAVQGAAGKKRVAMAHVIFNVTTDAIAFVCITPLLAFIALLGFTDPLISLVVFHSLFNFIGIVLFLPILKPFAAFLSRRFKLKKMQENQHIGETSPAVSDAALQAIRNDTGLIIRRVIQHNALVFSPPITLPDDSTEQRSPESMYRHNKKYEGEILGFALQVQEYTLTEGESRQLNQMLSAVREAVHSAKSLRDIQHNLDDFSQSTNEHLNKFHDHFRSAVADTYEIVFRLRADADVRPVLRDFADLVRLIHERHDQLHRFIYAAIDEEQVDDSEVSSLLNVNREIRNSSLALCRAFQEFLLEEGEIEAFEEARI